MKRLNKFVKTVVDGIQEKKGKNIRVVDLSKIDDTICNYLVICEGNTPTQVHAIAESVGDMMREKQDARPLTVDGQRNSLWIAIPLSFPSFSSRFPHVWRYLLGSVNLEVRVRYP